MNSFHNPKDYYGLLSGEMGIPEALVSSAEQMMPPSTTTIKSVPTQSGNASSSGLQLFQIASSSGNGYIKPGSMYLRCTITVTQTGIAGSTWKFSGSGSASSIINRLNVSCGGVMINQINNYAQLHDAMLNHSTNISFVQNDSVLYEDTGVIHDNSANDNKVVNVCIPILAPWFNNEQAVPLFLLNSPIVLEFLYGSVNASIKSNAGALPANQVTEFTVSNARIVYETLNVSPEFEASVKAKLASGALYTTYLDDYYNLQVASQQVLNYTMGLGLSSVKGLLWTNVLSANLASNVLDNNYLANGIQNMRVFLDGRLVNLDTLDTQSNIYSEMQRALQNLWDYSCTSNNQFAQPVIANVAGADVPALVASVNANVVAVLNAYLNKSVVANGARGGYSDITFLGGVNFNRLNDGAFAFTGSPCQNLNFILESGNANAALFPGNDNYQQCTTFVMVLYSQKLMIDANGAISLVR